jgi:putative endonuclease
LVSQHEIGQLAERLAQKHLLKLGYKILDTNWYHGHLELDIVAREGGELVIVEVKSRNGIRYEHPSEAVTNVKMKRLVEAAEAYIFKKGLNLETRFDVVTVIFWGLDFELEHFKDAFYPTL